MHPDLNKKIQKFLEWGRGRVAAQDRGILSNLRRGLNKETEHCCWPLIARYCDLTNDRERMIWTTVAAGFAVHEQSLSQGNMGDTMRRLALEGTTGRPEDALKSFDTRFRRILTCRTSDDVCQRLPGIIKAAKNKNRIPVDFESLFEDLWFWGEKVKLRWAQAYWGGKENDGPDPGQK